MMTSRSRFTSLVVGLFALTLGCAKASGSYATAPEGGYYGGGESGGGSPGGYDEDYAYAEEIVLTESTGLASRGRSAKKEMFKRDKMDAPMEAPAPPPDEAMDIMPVLEPEPSEPDPVEQAAQDERQIIYTATLQLAVYELDQTMVFAEDIPNRHGGWVQYRSDYMITLRVPADHLKAVIEELAELGLVLGKTLQADDVTAQYTDLASRIAVLEQLLVQLELLLKEAKTVEDSLKVRQELERVRIELEAAKAQMRQLAESISFSTLTLYLSQRGSGQELPSSNDPFPWVDELGVETTEYR